MTSTRAARFRLLGLALAVLIAGGLVWLLLGGEVDAVQRAVAATGAWGPVVYVVLHVLLTLVPVSKNLLSGVAGALFGLAGAYWLDAGTFVASLWSIWMLPKLGPAPDAERPSLRSIREGFRFVVSKKVLLGMFLTDSNAMVFGMPRALFPALAKKFLMRTSLIDSLRDAAMIR